VNEENFSLRTFLLILPLAVVISVVEFIGKFRKGG
jgi:hypothetical protein